ncbi:MAG TPA: Sec-independent protein translocase protein TatB [Dokdonella sp.]|uniref:Sec-independent protein translocase protein TatB n=1 Tax=Dokdonella sp. TaxID=2291710 RepID=UPI0025C71244|nr:Sec-independent protein translocase protein TatB [Dokdonella sp.]MBX3691131.1 Sec-independent protein translocase protein TatB [Dokdonella sp.]MCW5566888.1 Sec-independent protein translocase protein TatB [Dokdonella sp.]HNR91947.1 Sec-independent protein translocase protein TatB [Dokdonella sp.]
MFELSFGKMALIAVVALLVLGPERLPGAARTAGALLRRMRNSWQGVRAEIERELAAEDVKRGLHDAQHDLDLAAELRRTAADIESAVNPRSPTTPSDPSSDEPR